MPCGRKMGSVSTIALKSRCVVGQNYIIGEEAVETEMSLMARPMITLISAQFRKRHPKAVTSASMRNVSEVVLAMAIVSALNGIM